MMEELARPRFMLTDEVAVLGWAWNKEELQELVNNLPQEGLENRALVVMTEHPDFTIQYVDGKVVVVESETKTIPFEWQGKLWEINRISPDGFTYEKKDGDIIIIAKGLGITAKGKSTWYPYAQGATMEEAANDFWEQFTKLEPGEYVVAEGPYSSRRFYRWTGDGWLNVINPFDEPK
jgi:hypothetical protein